MRAVRAYDGEVQVLEVSPSDGPGVRVHVKAAGICGSDLHLHRFPLDAAPEAFATAADRSSGAIKVVLEP